MGKTIATLQMVLGSMYALYLWAAPDVREAPLTSAVDLLKIAPVAACSAGAHVASVLSMNLGAVSFAQIVKADTADMCDDLDVTMTRS